MDGDFRGHRAVQVRVDDREGKRFREDGSGAAQPGKGLDGLERAEVAVAADGDGCSCEWVVDRLRGEVGTDGSGAAVREVHLEDVEGGGDGELVFLREHERVDAIDRLGDVGHGDFISVALKDVERNPGEEGIAHGGLLGEVIGGAEFGSLAIPGAPFIDHQLYLVLPAELLDGSEMVGNNALHDGAAREQVVVGARVEIEGVASGELRGAARGVVMDGESP